MGSLRVISVGLAVGPRLRVLLHINDPVIQK